MGPPRYEGEWDGGAQQCAAGSVMLHCTRMARWNPSVRRWNRNAAWEYPEWGVETHQCGAGAVMLHRSGALESIKKALEP